MFRIIAMSVLLSAAPAQACNIPVFRFALERWEADRYKIEVIHRGAPTAEQQAKIDALRKFVDASKGTTNFDLSVRDFNKSSPEVQEALLENYQISQFPWVFVTYPETAEPETPVLYSGPVNLPAIARVIDSPARRDLARRLLSGDSAVWVFIDCGDAPQDELALTKLKTALDRLSKELTLPELSESPRDKLFRQDVPLKLAFSILRLSPTNPAERPFVNMLQNMEHGLRKSEPMVFPIFGRGHVLYGLVGRGITDTDENIASAARLLISKCTCEAKEMNPGVSLLMTADWDSDLAGQPVSTGGGSSMTLSPQEVPQPRSQASTDTAAPPVCPVATGCIRSIAMGLAAGLAVVSVLTFALSIRNRIK